MFKLLGFIVGCAVSLGTLIVVMGTPEFHFGDRAGDAERYQAAIEKLREKKPEPADPATVATTSAIDPDAEESVDAIISQAPDEPEELVSHTADAVSEAAEGSATASADDTTAAAPAAFDETERLFIAQDNPEDADPTFGSTGWQAIWNPFRSEIAARGFVRRLEQVTGIDYRVTKEQHGVYQVAFPYQNDDERNTRLAQIAAATGLDLGDPQP